MLLQRHFSLIFAIIHQVHLCNNNGFLLLYNGNNVWKYTGQSPSILLPSSRNSILNAPEHCGSGGTTITPKILFLHYMDELAHLDLVLLHLTGLHTNFLNIPLIDLEIQATAPTNIHFALHLVQSPVKGVKAKHISNSPKRLLIHPNPR